MIEYIRGRLTLITPTYLVVETHGVGYQVQFANPYLFSGREQQEVQIFTYQHVREDVIALYGFATREERSLFEKLIQVSGIGPKGALGILSAGEIGQLIAAIQMENLAYLTKLPGVGKKTAQRLILELKDKLDELSQYFRVDLGSQLAESAVTSHGLKQKLSNPALEEAMEALLALGYSEKEVQDILPQLRDIKETDWTSEEYLKKGLQLLLR